MVISVTDDKTADVAPVATMPAAEARDENGMTSDDVFDQLVDENRVVTSGSGSRVPVTPSALPVSMRPDSNPSMIYRTPARPPNTETASSSDKQPK